MHHLISTSSFCRVLTAIFPRNIYPWIKIKGHRWCKIRAVQTEMALQNKSHGGDDSVCAGLCACPQQSAAFSSISSVSQPKENQALCDTPEFASCLGVWDVFHPDGVFPPPTYTCVGSHALFKINKSLLIKTTAEAGGFRRRFLKPSCRMQHQRPLWSGTSAQFAPSSSSSLRSGGLGTDCARVNDQRDNEQSHRWKVKLLPFSRNRNNHWTEHRAAFMWQISIAQKTKKPGHHWPSISSASCFFSLFLPLWKGHSYKQSLKEKVTKVVTFF